MEIPLRDICTSEKDETTILPSLTFSAARFMLKQTLILEITHLSIWRYLSFLTSKMIVLSWIIRLDKWTILLLSRHRILWSLLKKMLFPANYLSTLSKPTSNRINLQWNLQKVLNKIKFNLEAKRCWKDIKHSRDSFLCDLNAINNGDDESIVIGRFQEFFKAPATKEHCTSSILSLCFKMNDSYNGR